MRANPNRSLPIHTRRRFLFSAGATAVCGLTAPAQAQTEELRIASNQGVENASLQRLMLDRGFFSDLAIEPRILESRTVSGPMRAVQTGAADLCMISAYPGVIPAIAQGAPLRLIGAAMRLPALALFSARANIRRLEDLRGCSVGVGPKHALLHILMLALLAKKRLPATEIRFVDAGSNAQVLEAVTQGRIDAGLSGTAGLSGPAHIHVLEDGRLWRELPEYTYQIAYASLDALSRKPEAIGRGLAAYLRMFRFLSAPHSLQAYLDARQAVAGAESRAEGEAIWRFVQDEQPYASEPGISPEQVAYQQVLNVKFGLMEQVLPFDRMVDLGPANVARMLI